MLDVHKSNINLYMIVLFFKFPMKRFSAEIHMQYDLTLKVGNSIVKTLEVGII